MPVDTRQILSRRLQALPAADFRDGHLEFLDSLGYHSDKIMPVPKADPTQFIQIAESASRESINKDKAKFSDWEKADILFQLTDEELSGQTSLFKATELRPQLLQSYLIFAIELKGVHYSRTDLSNITRQINRLFPMPVMVFYNYNDELSIAVINRRRNKREMHKDVLGKVTLIHGIKLTEPHRGHLDIIDSFSVKNLRATRLIDSFDALHSAWEEIFNVELLNKRFYRELSDWYFWAFDQVEFPDDVEKNRDTRNATSLIRLLTRLIFCWFIKEKGLIPENLFQPEKLNGVLKSLNAEDSTYYHAILQNLFFATLNQRMGKNSKGEPYRKFATDDGFWKNRSQYGVKTLFRYADAFIKPESALQLFEDIPFLNGGLFECLDREDDNGKVQYLDGFSRNKSKHPSVPNELFFGEPRVVDLSAIYADKKRRNQKVRGLIHILSGYKFTIVENTPIEQEIALDPELLGQVFENLLASYNPETQTTARKQTGSFYTPRPIVDYMITESLKCYLKVQLCKRLPGILEADADDGLDILFSYTEREHAFTDEERSILIQAIDNCKILDPACGSGAFPMGALHKLVFILQKLDPHNMQWMRRQIEKATEIDDVQAREAAIDAIERAFADNELDYGRKLYLIENCLYGVDIQPIAIQITKLRCFISLVCDQRASRNKVMNYGIRPLPNLETKFAAANTLMRMPWKEGNEQLGLDSSETLLKHEKDLEDVRHSHFSATTRTQKLSLQRKDIEIREKLAIELSKGIFKDNSIARRIVEWNPYDATSVAKFFDPEWMFGKKLRNGFHIVIGNPPYIQLQKERGKLGRLYKNAGYATFASTGDIYQLFCERGCELLRPAHGFLSFIISNSWLKAQYGKALRRYLAERHTPLRLLEMGKDVFENTIVDTSILLLREGVGSEPFPAVDMDKLPSKAFPPDDGLWGHAHPYKEGPWTVLSPLEQGVMDKIKAKGTPLKEWDISINYGIKTGYNNAFIIDNETKEELIAQDANNAKIIKPILRGRDIKRYQADWAGLWLIDSHNGYDNIPPIEIEDYPAIKSFLDRFYPRLKKRYDKGRTPYNLRNCAYHAEFGNEKLVWIELVENGRFAYDNSGIYCEATSFIMTGDCIKYLCALLNAKLIRWFLQQTAPTSGMGTLRWKKAYVELIPIPKLSAGEQLSFIELLESILTTKVIDPNADVSAIEAEIDHRVYELYELTAVEIAAVE